jgi:hypothetical protein
VAAVNQHSRRRAHALRRRRKAWARCAHALAQLRAPTNLTVAHANCHAGGPAEIGAAAIHLADLTKAMSKGRPPGLLGLVEARAPIPADAVAACGMVQYRHQVPGSLVTALVAPTLRAEILHDSGCDPRRMLWLRVTAPRCPAVAVCVAYLPCFNGTFGMQYAPDQVNRSDAHDQLRAAVQRYAPTLPVLVMGDLKLRVGCDTPPLWARMTVSATPAAQLWPPTGEVIQPGAARPEDAEAMADICGTVLLPLHTQPGPPTYLSRRRGTLTGSTLDYHLASPSLAAMRLPAVCLVDHSSTVPNGSKHV